ncbi:hypothetical protein CQ12_18595 [Bradyrhizobium jicamae]|uniref:Uncharacterized protein n=1 Tax=Bradyrhizobium jicamae TaxID=280332 RepID=A0A0R3L9T7_9BRAD|nr:hypothetical protein CQ12_18595 [Bradyrhizobium jicamae]
MIEQELVIEHSNSLARRLECISQFAKTTIIMADGDGARLPPITGSISRCLDEAIFFLRDIKKLSMEIYGIDLLHLAQVLLKFRLLLLRLLYRGVVRSEMSVEWVDIAKWGHVPVRLGPIRISEQQRSLASSHTTTVSFREADAV